MSVTLFTNHPFTVEHQSKAYALDKGDVAKIILATVIGSLFFLVGGIFAFYGASYYFRSKKIEQLTAGSNPQLQKIDQVKKERLPPAPNNQQLDASPLPSQQSSKAQFISVMESTMGVHLSPAQKQTLPSLYDMAMQAHKPRAAFENLINGRINQPNGWGAEKAGHILFHLLPLMPINNTAFFQALKAQFINTMESAMGSHLSPAQKQTLSSMYDMAAAAGQPREALENLINGRINQPNGWGAEKAGHILLHLLPLMPQSGTEERLSPVKAIAAKHISAINTKLVCFYKTGPTEFLGNFALCPQGLQIWGQAFKCSEAAFQWRKYYLAAVNNNRQDLLNDPLMQRFFTSDGEQAFTINRQLTAKYPNVFANQWRSGVRDQVMWQVLSAKFQQNSGLAQLLQETKGAYLLEHNEAKRDDYWSDNSDGTGKNMLGKMLMAIRDGTPCPPPNDAADQHKVKAYAHYANQPGSLSYTIF